MRTPGLLTLAILGAFALPACNKEPATANPDLAGADLAGADLTGEPAPDLASGPDLASSCPRLPRPDDSERAIVVSHPYKTPDGSKSDDYEVLSLSATGTLTRPNQHFSLSRATNGEIVFTPDGELGFVVEENGTIGIFKLGSGAPQVIAAKHMPGQYTSRLVVAPAGDTLYLLNSQTEANGGGIYALPINCDGTLGDATTVTVADVPFAMIPLPGNKAAVYARTLDGSGMQETTHILALGPPAQRLTSVVTFPGMSDDPIVTGSAITHDGRFLLFGDNGVFTGVPNRVGVVEVTASGLRAVQVVTPIEDPISIVTSPFDNAALVSSGTGDALLRLRYDPSNATTPFVNQGKLTYSGAKPQLPGSAVVISRGTLKGRAFVADLQGVRQVRFETNGDITDLGTYSLGSDYNAMVGAIGIQP